jgi:dinuclear metal center YbgI/SA1388 family protein
LYSVLLTAFTDNKRSYMDKTQIVAAIERTAPLAIAADWDKSGVQIPCVRDEVTHLAVCLDPTSASFARALDAGADMILAHHPLLMSPRFFDRDDDVLSVVRMLMRADVMLYSAHTSLDANIRGPVSWLVSELGMVSASVLEPTGEMTDEDGLPYGCGFGQVGTLADPVSLSDILQLIQPACPRLVRALPDDLTKISALAVCPGSGGSLADAAARAGAQLLITGDMKYHSALEAPLPVLDVGHFCLEETMMRRFARSLSDTLDGVDVTFIGASDPFFNPCR